MHNSPMALSEGTKLGRYEIRSKIGAGGMGEVYLAQDTQLRRSVALKILPAEFTHSEERLRRFEQEAYAASALNHPNIITIHEIGKTDSAHYIVTEFIDGESLRQLMQDGPVSVGKVLDVAVQIASALATAHAAGIIHRDIKPENVMLRRDGVIKVLDFGLAKLTQNETGVNSEALTRALVNTSAGMVMGTPSYMSPEQARGTDTDARTDIWSLGVVVYELAAGRLPFEGATPTEAIARVIEREPAPLARYAPELPAELERIVTKALTKDRDQRYQTAKDLLIDLKRLKQRLEVESEIERVRVPEGFVASTAGGQVTDVPTSIPVVGTTNVYSTSNAEYFVPGIKRHKLAAAIVFLVIVLGAVGFGLYQHARNSEVAIESIAVLPFDNQNRDPETEYLSDGLTDSIINSLTQLPNLKVIARSSVFRYKGKQTDPIAVANELGVRAVLTGRVIQHGDRITIGAELIDVRDNKQLWGERYERNLSDLLSVQREIAQEITSNLRLKLSGAERELATKHYTENPEAYQFYLKGRFFWNKKTGEAIKTAIEYFNQAIEKDPSYALAYAGLADCYVVTANPQSPKEKMPKARAAAMRAMALDATLAEPHNALARVLAVYDWDWAGAEKEFKRAIELNPRYAGAHQWYGGYLETMGRAAESLAERKEALALDPLSVTMNFELALAYYYARDYERAIQQFRKALELDPNFPPVYGFLPEAYEQKGMYAEAISGFQKGITLKGGTEWTFSMSGLGHAYGLSGRKAEAQAVLDELQQTSQEQYVPADSIALVYAGLGEKDRAFTWLEKAYEEHSFKMATLKVDPQWDNLRSDPRFADLLRRVGLPQ